jgi:hypothetical protein
MAPDSPRLSYADSIAVLKDRVGIIGDMLPVVDRVPSHDDVVLGPSIFRTLVEDVSLAGLTMTGLYVGRSRLRRVSFSDSELRLAAFNWSDIEDCTFEGVDLTGADLRACQFVRCSFRGAKLAGTDLRCSTFEGCPFDGANLEGARLYRSPGLLRLVPRVVTIPRFGFQVDPRLTHAQRAQVQWCREAPVPGGG